MNQIYLAWNDGDYYGPDPVGDFVYDSVEAAKLAIDKHRQRFPDASVWTLNEPGWPGLWRRGNYYIETFTPKTLADVETIPDQEPAPPVNAGARDVYTFPILGLLQNYFNSGPRKLPTLVDKE